VVARVYTDEGIAGIGQTVAPAPWYGETAEAIKANIDKYLAPALLDQDPFDIERLYGRMFTALRGGRYAITALEYALWDIKGRALGVPVYQLLGGRCSPGALLHAFVERESPAETAARINELAAEGWTWFKTKVGFGAGQDVEWYEQLRGQVDSELQFQLDGNAGYSLGEAIVALTQLERIGGLGLIEQPVRFLDEMAELGRRLVTPLQCDEAVVDPRSVYEIGRQQAGRVLHFKIHKFGGLLQAKRMDAVAEAAGLEISVAPYFDVLAAAAAHFAAASPNVRWPAGASDMEDTLLVEPFNPVGQLMIPNDRPGFGVAIDQDKLEFYGRDWS
jgi:L-alanine-DL-glutamate epimerase-like enolase superfamily enzyme